MKWIDEDARELYSQMDDDLILTAYLIQERIKGTQSRWYPWIRVGDVFSMSLDAPITSNDHFILFQQGDGGV